VSRIPRTNWGEDAHLVQDPIDLGTTAVHHDRIEADEL
jgi:hypothetical protein